eukprot:TRINITY_DN3129_c0_g1_i1.p1 TRINITY_DN3129_c0_g1~~TRINITY_DN3129_c0_g1_i1.p1  ORF type:complete len:872 (+),score=199.74 TRINITY_DN3129_c0_g1_i1:35-2617(+)
MTTNLGYKFSNLCGPVYTQGNIIFSKDGNKLFSPIGNRISSVDLIEHASITFPYELRSDITRLDIHPNDQMILAIDEDGIGAILSTLTGSMLHKFNFKEKVLASSFSPCGNYLAISQGRYIDIYRTPSMDRQYSAFVKLRRISGHQEDVTYLRFTDDSQFILSGGADTTGRVFPLLPKTQDEAIYKYKTTFAAHRDPVKCIFTYPKEKQTVSSDFWHNNDIFTVDAGGAVYQWTFEDKGWVLVEKTVLDMHSRVIDVAYSSQGVFGIGFANGSFALYDLPSVSLLQSLSVSKTTLSTICFEPKGHWLAMGVSGLGQLLVWEWGSESFILKQQGHLYPVNCVDFSADGALMVSGGDDGKIKVWSARHGFSFVTFAAHGAPITGIKFLPNDAAVISCSVDGTIKAHDLVRYRCFRTMHTPSHDQFSSISVDPSGEFIAAGSSREGLVYVFELATGKLLDTLGGHDAPVSCVSFLPSDCAVEETLLLTCSWDCTVRIIDITASEAGAFTITLSDDCLSCAWHPSGLKFAIACLDGSIYEYNREGQQTRVIETRKDAKSGRLHGGLRTAANQSHDEFFTNICYSPDGKLIFGSGRSKYVCAYWKNTLVARFSLSQHAKLSGAREMLNSKTMTEYGDISEYDDHVLDADERFMKRNVLPGARIKVNTDKRVSPDEIRAQMVMFSKNGRNFAVATTLGVHLFSLDSQLANSLEPLDLDIELTPETFYKYLENDEYNLALITALRLQIERLIVELFYRTPCESIEILTRGIPVRYLKFILKALANELDISPNVEIIISWILNIFNNFAQTLRVEDQYQTIFRQLRQVLRSRLVPVEKNIKFNVGMLEFFSNHVQQSEVTGENNLMSE